MYWVRKIFVGHPDLLSWQNQGYLISEFHVRILYQFRIKDTSKKRKGTPRIIDCEPRNQLNPVWWIINKSTNHRRKPNTAIEDVFLNKTNLIHFETTTNSDLIHLNAIRFETVKPMSAHRSDIFLWQNIDREIVRTHYNVDSSAVDGVLKKCP